MELLMLNRYRALDLNAPSPDTGATLLHVAVGYKDTQMIELAATKGADVFAADKHGHSCLNATKDERLRALLRQLGNANPNLLLAGPTTAPTTLPMFKGWLGKWTNLTGRYKPRWFVLEDGILSYYHSPSDQGKHARGSISLRYATVKADGANPLRFEVLAEPGKNGSIDTKLYLRGSHPAERARWVQLLRASQAYFASPPTCAGEAEHATVSNPSLTTSLARARSADLAVSSPPIVVPKPRKAQVANEEDDWSINYAPVAPASAASASSTEAPPGSSSSSNRLSRMATSITGRVKTPNRLSSPIGFTPLAGPSGSAIIEGSNRAGTPNNGGLAGNGKLALGRTATPMSNKYAGSARSYNGTDLTPPHAEAADDASLLYGEDHGSVLTGDAYGKSESSNLKQTHTGLPMDNELSLLSNSLTTRAELAKALAELMVDRCASGTEVLRDADGALVSDGGPVDTLSTRLAMRDDLVSIVDLLAQYQSVVERREAYLRRRYTQEISAKLLWEENLQTLAKQYEDQERTLANLTEDATRKRRTIKELRHQLALQGAGAAVTPRPQNGSTATLTHTQVTPKASLDRSAFPAAAGAAGLGVVGAGVVAAEADSSEDDDEDEFYDAVERGKLTNVTVEAQLTEPPAFKDQLSSEVIRLEGVKPYEHLRHEMPIGKDVRPSVSLWGVLKNNIGKDLTKISFPVSFNEPTSMLQRMAEDMEFSECLDAASRTEDSTKRIAYVAAFAMSNYSSTIGRIAKPFNPLLGETFEYISPEKEYRYLSEQVSHHPPISACFAESPGWQYFGCVDAKSKFLGRTFEIRPTGVAHANLKIPEAWVKAAWTPEKQKTAQPVTIPPNGETTGANKYLEHYTWNKVTTCVSGFLIGQTTIDHFGDMEVQNHATGDRCVLTFKQRGWRAKDACGIRGAVYDAQGNLRWEIAGRWNSQLVARRIGTDEGELNPDHTVSPSNAKATGTTDQYLLLWKNSEKPPSPFNLPPFAITLNDLPKGLHLWLPPTDCRLRPDLRAFETGKFDEANDLKIQLEDLQRTTRRQREAGELPPHQPRWFTRTLDPDSNDTLWAPHKDTIETKSATQERLVEVPDYWLVRDKVGCARLQAHDESASQWPNVEHVFGDLEVKS